MNATQLLTHFDRLAEAPNAVPRLRRFILDLAVRGKLVEQDAGDEPAADLLKRIQAEKAQLFKAGKLKRMGEPTQNEFDVSFVLPKQWAWTQLGDVAQYGVPDKADTNAVLPTNTWVLDLEDIEKDTSRLLVRVESEARPFRSTKTVFRRDDVLFGKLRPYLNKVIVADRDGVCTTEIIPIRGYCGLASEYTRLVLRSTLTMKRVDLLMYGVKMPRLGTADAAALSYPLPPLAEQHRIVAKVDELMALCDQLEAAQQERERRRDRLAAASLQRLNQPALDASGEAQREHARFHLQNLPRLAARPEHIKAMRQAILNLAVRGRLLPQETSEESATTLLEHIQLEKMHLVKRGALKKVNSVNPIQAEEMLFSIPEGWKWVRIGDLLLGDSQNGYSMRPDDAADGIPILRISAGTVRPDGIVAEEEFKLIGGITAAQRKQYTVSKGDLLACRFNGNRRFVGRISLYTGYLGNSPIYPDKLIRLRLIPGFVLPELVRYFAESEPVRKDIEGYCATTVGNWGISAANMKEVMIPLPPLAEQHRIVAKVDELVALCDQLEAQLTTTQTDSRRLLEAVLEAALAPA